jgi:hypothetical protein
VYKNEGFKVVWRWDPLFPFRPPTHNFRNRMTTWEILLGVCRCLNNIVFSKKHYSKDFKRIQKESFIFCLPISVLLAIKFPQVKEVSLEDIIFVIWVFLLTTLCWDDYKIITIQAKWNRILLTTLSTDCQRKDLSIRSCVCISVNDRWAHTRKKIPRI